MLHAPAVSMSVSKNEQVFNNGAIQVPSSSSIHIAFGVGTTRVSGSGVEIGVDDVLSMGDVNRFECYR